MKMSLEYINMLLAALPEGVRFHITWKTGVVDEYMTRGLPGLDRRLTRMESGKEAFLPWMDIHGEMESITIPEFTVEIIP